jgi:hypothetical protein
MCSLLEIGRMGLGDWATAQHHDRMELSTCCRPLSTDQKVLSIRDFYVCGGEKDPFCNVDLPLGRLTRKPPEVTNQRASRILPNVAH